ncbi:hypothetical protein MM213_15750 [Belliella sp. R4-6]|uniref:Uncharacterized protein n=1 Tax=Belliella alkalica TaxID=1730871 RepID=A0ABS9VG78_9BACT|nr:hypothetical protein [Belliella alkalica]MCH7414955.1 hypothetical protein [Belliella alkalica]
MKKIIFASVFVFAICNFGFSQTSEKVNLDSLMNHVLTLEENLYQINLNLHQSQKRLKTGIFIATVGYSVTILGGQLLGTRPQLGKTLLYTGGAIGIGGTVTLVSGFNRISLGPPRKPIRYQ